MSSRCDCPEPEYRPPLTLVILAAGQSRRFGAPKPLEPLGPSGEALPEYGVHDALACGFTRVVFVVHPDLRAAYERRHRETLAGVEVHYAEQRLDSIPGGGSVPPGRTRPWGTGHAVLAAATLIDGPFAVMNGDDYYGPHPFGVLARHLRDTAGARPPRFAIAGFRLDQTLSPVGGVSRAVCETDADHRLRRVREVLSVERAGDRIRGEVAATGEHVTLPPDAVVSMNLWGFTRAVMPLLGAAFGRFVAGSAADPEREMLIGDSVQAMVDTGEAVVDVLPVDGRWLGVTHPADAPRVRAALAALVDEGKYPSPLRPAAAPERGAGSGVMFS
ncbi:MAG: NTP transferase domain-containing protein [Ectothiorhodospiraceae bacterium]|nr:NTP transferase domain-containing protein [Chromatiales bacterium]MCP5154945.1 NTP transferase domain-containing protein [Ectothiorhodospiraceae bacterium]